VSFVRTILGDIPPAQFGVCYAHEHVYIGESFTTHVTPDFRIDDVQKQAVDLRAFREAGGRAVIDSMPAGGAGRNVLKLVELAQLTGVHIVCPTGLHLRKYYPPGHWGSRYDAPALARVFITEIQHGVDANDLAGPEVKRTPHRAGLIKIASGLDTLDEHERTLFQAAAQAHRVTGCPILTHCEQGTAALEQVELLGSHDVDLRHVVLSHTDRVPDLAYHRAILRAGVRVEYDSAFRWSPDQGNPTLDLVAALAPEFPDQILLGMDAARRRYWVGHGGGPGLAWLLTHFVPMLRQRGVSQELIDRIFVHNPAATYRFDARALSAREGA
jgi:5-phospho-D-xylono-1,4-lactonase